MDGEEYAPEKAADYYPPALTGMRGNHDGTFTFAHRLRDGGKWDAEGPATRTGEAYDLVVVGGGISGLAAAYFYRKNAGAAARILILDNHDDFGGHAKRNEFRAGKRMLLSYGGTQSIESPGSYSQVAKDLIADVGIQVERFYKDYDRKLYAKLGTATFFNQETFGQDRLLTGTNVTPWPEFLANAPLSDAVRRDIARVYTEKVDYMAGLSKEQKLAKLATISYANYLTNFCKVTPEALPFFQTFPHDLFGVGIDAVSAAACYMNPDDYESFTYPGFDGLGFPEREKEEPYIFHFPDGNASVARLLVRSLIPGAVPGTTMEDVVIARADYGKLDQPEAKVRLRLNSTVVHVQHAEAAANSPKEVEVSYMRGGKLQSVRGKNCVLACYNMMIPYICPELPEKQKAGAVVSREDAAGLHARGAAQLDFFFQIRRASNRCAGQLSHLHRTRFPGEHRPIPVPEQSRRTHGAVPLAHSVQARASDARSISCRPRGIAGHAFCNIRAQHPGSVGQDAGRSGLRPHARH